MTRRLNFSKATQDRTMRVRGTESLDEPGIAEQARTEFRNVINERGKDLDRSPRTTSQGRISAQARADFEERQDAPWRIVTESPKPKERFTKKLRQQKKPTAKKSNRSR